MTTTTKPTIQDAANRAYANFAENVGRQVRVMEQAEAAGHWEWAESIRESLMEDPLSVSIDTIDPNNEEVRWNVLLGWGGPAYRILVVTNMEGEIQSATYEFQDWFEPWTAAENQDEQLMERYAETFYYSRIGITQDGMVAD